MDGLITEEQREAIYKNELRAILAKQQSGKTLTKDDKDTLDKLTIKSKNGAGGASNVYAKNQVELAKAIGVDRKTLWRWKKNPTFPSARADGRYHIQEVVQWKEENGESAGDLVSKESEQVKSIQLHNEKLEIQIGILKGDYTENTIIASQVTEMVLSAKRELLALPSGLAPQVVGQSVAGAEKIIKNAINDALRSLSNNQIVNDKNSSSKKL
jgi:predicted DNA-binding transcriptional regulator AlpA